jgi:2-methylisocitrate lyase-like PEP mutase family enzyme
MTDIADRNARFRSLHQPGSILVLPNAWDAASARVAEDCGAKAIATSSAAVSWAHGYPDGENLPIEVHLAMTAEIVRAVSVPVSVDSEAGFSNNPDTVADLAVKLARAGASGINLEDGSSPPNLLAEKISAIKQACKKADIDLFLNARTDVYLRQLVPPERAVEESIARGRLYQEAGADGMFVPLLVDLAGMKTISVAVTLPLNVLIRPGLAPVDELKSAGIRRVSAGSDLCRAALGAARRATREFLELGRYDSLYAESEGLPNMNALLAKTR